jgi:hypothetical protein
MWHSTCPEELRMSKRFTFPLQKALDWYRQSLSTEQAALHRMIYEIQMLDQLKESLEQRRHTEHEQLHRTGPMSGKDLRGLASYSMLIGADLTRLAAERVRKGSAMAEQRRRVAAHHRRVRVIEELKQRRKTEWRHSLSVEEDSLASDLFLASMAREART